MDPTGAQRARPDCDTEDRPPCPSHNMIGNRSAAFRRVTLYIPLPKAPGPVSDHARDPQRSLCLRERLFTLPAGLVCPRRNGRATQRRFSTLAPKSRATIQRHYPAEMPGPCHGLFCRVLRRSDTQRHFRGASRGLTGVRRKGVETRLATKPGRLKAPGDGSGVVRDAFVNKQKEGAG